MPMAEKFAEFRKLSENELIRRYDEMASNTQIGLAFLRDEIAHREADRQYNQMLLLTKQMRNLTIVVTVLTIINVILVFFQCFPTHVSLLDAANQSASKPAQ
jgi:hypothetical protein